MDRLKVKNDFIFQKLFGEIENKEILISFLNAVLESEQSDKLSDIEIIDGTELKRDSIDDKFGILDILAKTVSGEQINIEIQLVNQYNMDQRTLFYWSKIFTEQLKVGQPYKELKKTITINILDFNFINLDKYSTVFHLWEDTDKNCKLTDVLEIRFLELPKFRKKEPDINKPLERWMVFIEDSPKEVLEMAMNAEPAIAKAEEVLKRLGSFDEIRKYYLNREKVIRDEVSRITGAREEGIAEGREKCKAEGIAEGREMGIKEGKAEGQIETSIRIAKSLLGILDEQTIADKTGLSLSEIIRIKNGS